MNSDQILQTLHQAADAQRSGNLSDAATLCESLLTIAAARPEAMQLLGLIRKQQGRLEEAEQLLLDSATLAPKRVEFQNNLGNLYTQLNRFADAEAAYLAALTLDPQFRPATLALARLHNRSGRFVEAEALARQLIRRNNADAQACVVLGSALRAQDLLADSEAAFRSALAVKPDYAVALHNLGAVLADRYQPREALECYNAATRAGVSGPEFEANRARALIALDRIDDACLSLETAVARYPNAADAQGLLAKLRFMRGEHDFARDLRKTLEQGGVNTLLHCTYAQLLRGAGLPAEASEQLSAAINQLGEQPPLLAELASAWQEQGDYEQALSVAKRASVLQPDDLRLQDRVVEALMSLGEADRAAALISKARQLEPLNQWHIACEATVARMQGSPQYEYLYDYERFIGIYELPVPDGWSSLAAFNHDFANLLRERIRFEVAPLDQSLRHGTQTPVSLLADNAPVVMAYLQALIAPITDYRSRIGSDPQHPFTSRNNGLTVLSGAWSVTLRKGGYHVNHVHPEGWISSAYYVSVPDDTDEPDTQQGWLKFGEPRYPVPGIAAAHFVKPRSGRLVLFPSYFWHGTVPLTAEMPRVTAPVDIVTQPYIA